MRPRGQRLPDVIASIYDAALDWRAWPAALDQLADALGADAAQFGSYDAASYRLQTVMPRIDPQYRKSFVEYWASRNVLWQKSAAVPLGEVMQPEMFLPAREWRRTDFFNEWYSPQRLDSMIATNLVVEGPVSTVIAVLRKAEFSSDDSRLFRVLIPHVQRAVQLQLRLAAAEDPQNSSVEVLNRLRQGVLLVDETAKVHFANRAAEKIVTRGKGVHIKSDILRLDDPAQSRALGAMIESCVVTATRGDGQPGGRIRVRRGKLRPPLSILVIPLRPQAPWTRLYRPCAIVFINDPEQRAVIQKESLIADYGLTGAEAALALEIIAGRRLQDAAERLHISVPTARTHLAHIFQKTGTGRQAELIRVLLQGEDSGPA